MSEINQNVKNNESLLPKSYSLRESKQNTQEKNKIKNDLLNSKEKNNDAQLLNIKHKKVNIEQDYFECSFEGCGKRFYEKGAFRKHQLTHGDKLYTCKHCGKKFLDNSKLKRHSLVHTGEKPYKCDICEKRFSLDFNLRTHLRIHTGEKPYACTFPGCFKRFSQSSNLSAHEKTHETLKSNDPMNNRLEIFNNTPFINNNDYQIQRPIFKENPLKLMIFNKYSGSMTLNNLLEINKLYELMNEGIRNRQNCFYQNDVGGSLNNLDNNYMRYNDCNNVNGENKKMVFAVSHDLPLKNNQNLNNEKNENSNVNDKTINKDKKIFQINKGDNLNRSNIKNSENNNINNNSHINYIYNDTQNIQVTDDENNADNVQVQEADDYFEVLSFEN